jgi:hypothetical protein
LEDDMPNSEPSVEEGEYPLLPDPRKGEQWEIGLLVTVPKYYADCNRTAVARMLRTREGELALQNEARLRQARQELAEAASNEIAAARRDAEKARAELEALKKKKDRAPSVNPAHAPAPASLAGLDAPGWAREMAAASVRQSEAVADLVTALRAKAEAKLTEAKTEAQFFAWHHLPSWEREAMTDAFEWRMHMHFAITHATARPTVDAFQALRQWLTKADWTSAEDVLLGRRLLRALRNTMTDVPQGELLDLLEADGNPDLFGAYSAKDAWAAAVEKLRKADKKTSKKDKDSAKDDTHGGRGRGRQDARACWYCGMDGHPSWVCQTRIAANHQAPTGPRPEAVEYRRANNLPPFPNARGGL